MFQAKLQMRLESGEPKCANCRYWELVDKEHVGACMRGVDASRLNTMPVTTTDLTVCSKWEMKDGQTKAETPSE